MKSNRMTICHAGLKKKSCLNIMNISSIAFFGDSTMLRLYHAYVKRVNLTCSHMGPCWEGNCSEAVRWIGKKIKANISQHWVPPRYGIEGPIMYGLQNPGCLDMTNCHHSFDATQCTRKIPAGENARAFYYSVEFSRDVALQTDKHNSTQEVVGELLSYNPADMCIVNAGVHDQAIEMSVKQHFDNVERYLELLKPHCGKLVWQGLGIMGRSEQYLQGNSISYHWNMNFAAYDIYATYFMDIWNFSKSFKLVDNVHMEPIFYDNLSSFYPDV